jgi:Carboxypeptidase regulatory-like domain
VPMHLPRISVFLSLLAPCVVVNAQVLESQIAGRVIRADNGRPIEGAAIELRPTWVVNGNGQFQTAITDSRGEYRFVDRLSDGTYEVDVSADGFVSHTYSRDGTVEGVFQRVDTSTRLRGIDFELKREVVIRGALTEAEGKSAGPGISVTAVRKEKRENGQGPMRPAASTKTDPSGRFVLAKLESGTYFVCVNGPNGYGDRSKAGPSYRETWYGNTHSAEGAIPLALAEGEEQNDIRIAVELEPRYRVLVWPSGPAGPRNPDRYQLRIEGWSHSYRHQPDGSYEIPGIPAGHYRLVSVAWAGTEYLGEGDMSFNVTDADVTLHLTVGGLGEIQGVMKWDDAPGKLPVALMIGIQSHEGAAQGSDLDSAGYFTFRRVLPGFYEFKLLKNPVGVVLRSVRCGGTEVTPDTPLRVVDSQKVKDCEAVLGTDTSATGTTVQ